MLLARRRGRQAKISRYREVRGQTTWFKVKNPDYSQAEGMQELFSGAEVALEMSALCPDRGKTEKSPHNLVSYG